MLFGGASVGCFFGGGVGIMIALALFSMAYQRAITKYALEETGMALGTASEKAVEAIQNKVDKVILPFPGGICRSGSKAGSLKYKLKASTNHPFCPRLKTVVADSKLSKNVNCVYEIVINGLSLASIKNAMREGIETAASVPGVEKITAGNYGGKLGPYKAFLKEVLGIA